MKRLISLLCAAMMLFGVLAGCEENKNEKKELITVGFSQLGSESDWRAANTASMTQAFSEENGYELLYENAMQKQENQLAAVRNFILQGVDIIVLAPVSETGWDNVLMEAKEAGIPVIIVDREVSVQDESLYLSAIGSDFYKEGQIATSWLEDTLKEAGREKEKINILHIKGTQGATAQIMRTRALEEAAQKNPNWNVTAQLWGEFTEAKGYEVVRDQLKLDKDVDVIYSENDNMTFGAMRALDEAGMTYGEDGDVMIISFDAVRAALEHCYNKKINLCVECNPLHGPRVDELIKQYMEGNEIPKQIYVNDKYFTPKTLTPGMISIREY